MKDLKDIERLGLEELMEIADDESVKAPEGLLSALTETIEADALVEEVSEAEELTALKFPTVFRRFAPYVAAAAVVVMAFVAIPSHPKDTFDDPALAYAELEKTFAYISDKTGRALDMARAGGDVAMEKTVRILDF